MGEPVAGKRSVPGDKRAGRVEMTLTVDEVADLTPRLRAVWFEGAPDGFAYEPGQDLTFRVPTGDDRVRRRYTIRGVDGLGRIEVWFVLHDHGPAAEWASSATGGEQIVAVGPRGKVVPVPGRAWHLFVGDESGLAALLAMAEAVPHAQVTVLVEVEGPEDEIDAPVPVRWLHRAGAPAGDNDLLETAVAGLDLPTGEGHVYLAGEKATVKRIRAVLEGRGIDRDHQSSKGYWKLSRS